MVEIGGLDDAGKGPIIGPMVIAGVVTDEKGIEKLKKMGVTDSKLLTSKKRADLCEKIRMTVKRYKLIIIPPQEIDEAVLSNSGMNLNWLEGEKMAEIINSLNPAEAIVDCPSPNLKMFTKFLEKIVKNPIKIICYHNAERFMPVAAASILAKYARDAEVAKIQKMMPESIGSGYPADPKTKEFIAKYYKVYPEIMRKSWSTYQNLVKKGEQKNLKEF